LAAGPDDRLLVVVDNSSTQVQERQLLFQNNLLQSASMALFDAKTSAEAASRRKTQFLTYASHEIRTPLQAVLGFAEQLEEDRLSSEERREAIKIIRRNGEHLLTVLGDILDLARIESDQLELRFVSCDLRREVDSVVDLFGAMARERGVAIVVEERTPLPARVGTDQTRLRQVLINLVGNAVRASRADADGELAQVTIGLAAQAAPPLVRIAIEDQGPGMTEVELRRLLEPFAEVAAVADQRLGTGLGLVISQRLVRLLGGDLVARSAVGHGTRVDVTLDPGPLEPLEQWRQRSTKRGKDVPEDPLRARVLLAEDGRDNRLLISTILRRAGAEVAMVEDGCAAVEAVAAAAAGGRPFDLVVMDLQMPKMDGYEATARLRAEGCAVPILALTADALAGTRQRCLDVGCDAYASKPIDRRALVHAVRNLLESVPR
jgi:signal transduction histidine kinase/ActR/RegA family two-component response regulator